MAHLTLPDTSLGPVVELILGVSAPHQEAFRSAGRAIPSSVVVRALIDSGAGVSCVDLQTIGKLGIPQVSVTQIVTPSTGSGVHVCPVFAVSVILQVATGSFSMDALGVAGCDLSQQKIDMLLGRDILAYGLFVYDGAAKRFSLSF